jgi:molybdate transport system ATP-binding protein
MLLERVRTVQRAQSIPILYVTHSPGEAIAVGAQLFLLDRGRIIAEGPPLDVLGVSRLAPAGTTSWEDVGNIFPARVIDHYPEQGASHVQLEQGPELVVPFLDRPQGSRLLVAVRADDILLARQPLGGLSARNQIPCTIERIIPHGPQAEAVVRTLGLTWIVSLVAPAVEQLELTTGSSLHLIIKARSCHVLFSEAN